MTVLPSVASLNSLRRLAKTSRARRPFIGFGNPLLNGTPEMFPWHAQLAQEARANQSCATLTPKPLQQVDAGRGLQDTASYFRGGLANVEAVKRQLPLPDTAKELCAVAASIGADPRDVYLGANATERAIKSLSKEGRLANYRIVHFATHGLVAGEMESLGGIACRTGIDAHASRHRERGR